MNNQQKLIQLFQGIDQIQEHLIDIKRYVKNMLAEAEAEVKEQQKSTANSERVVEGQVEGK
jgi:hypothetical protein